MFWPEDFRVNDLALELAGRGNRVDVLAGMPNYYGGAFPSGYGWSGPYQEMMGPIRIFRFPVIPRGKGRLRDLVLHYLTWVAGALSRLLVIGGGKWDAVLVYQSSPVTAALPALLVQLMYRKRTVIWVQDLWPEVMQDVGFRFSGPVMKLAGLLSGWIYRSFDAVLIQNPSMGASLAALGVRPDRTICVPNWAEDLYLDPCPGDPPPAAGAFTIMFAGNLGRAQALPTLVDAAEILKGEAGLRWILLGDGPMKEWVEAEVLRRGLAGCIELPGRQPLADMPRWYARADVMLLTLGKGGALARTVPSRLQGYLAAGKPVIASADGEAMRVVNEARAGYAAQAEDAGALAEILRRMMRLDPSERADMGRNGRKYFRAHYERSRCIGAIEASLTRGCRFRGSTSRPPREQIRAADA